MKTSRLALVSFLGLSSLLAFACGNNGSSGGGDGEGDTSGDGDGDGDGDNFGDGDAACEAGSKGCECYGKGSCGGDLSCLNDTCVDAGGNGDTGGTAGDGDGDAMGGSTSDEECTRSAECDDDDPCTQDACVDAMCQHDAIAGRCETGTCVSGELETRSETVCADAVDSGGAMLCTSSTCSDTATPGCDVEYTFGMASSTSEVGQDRSRTTVISLPVTGIDLTDAQLTIGTSNCLVTVSVEDGAPLLVDITLVTDSAAMCGGEEVIVSRLVNADLSNLVIDITDGEGTATLCAQANTEFAPGGLYRIAAETAFSESLQEALGNLDRLASVGTTCSSCSGDCEGLSCAAPAAAD